MCQNPSGCSFQIWSDNKAALGIVFERSSSTAQKSLSEVAGHVGAAVSPRISLFGHVAGHSGHPWNELADTLCDHMSRGVLPLVCDWDQLVLRHRPPLRPDSSTLRWAPVLRNSYQSEGYPSSVWSNGTVPFSLPTTLSDRQQFQDVSVVYQGRERVSSSCENEQEWCFEWKPFGIATFNALTMKSIRGSKRVPAQSRDAACQVVFFQEIRRKSDAPFRVTVEDEWFLVQSRATPEGRGGCAIGIDVKSVFGQIGTKDVVSTSAQTGPTWRMPKKLTITADQVNVLRADDRVLAITVNLAGHMIGFASLRAPDSTKGSVTNAWWCNACAILRRFPVDVVPWIGIDANIALPEVWAVAVSRERGSGAMRR